MVSVGTIDTWLVSTALLDVLGKKVKREEAPSELGDDMLILLTLEAEVSVAGILVTDNDAIDSVRGGVALDPAK